MTIHISSLHNVFRSLIFWRMDYDFPLINFADDLIPLIESGSKTITYRLDGKFSKLKPGDVLHYGTKKSGARGLIKITKVDRVTFQELLPQADGHEPYKDKKDQTEVFTRYYGRTPEPMEQVDVLHFILLSLHQNLNR